MKKITNEKSLNILIFLFLIIQPFLEVYWLYHFDGINNSFTFSPSTLVRIGWFFLICIIFLFNLNKKRFIHMVGLTGAFVLFAFLHDYFSSSTAFYWSETYSFIGEMFYLLRLAIPIYLLYIFSNFKIDEKLFDKSIFIVSYIFGITMIVTNIFMIALPAYPFTEGIEGNLFTWFTARQNDLTFEVLATKGIFNQANQMSGFIILIFPLLVYSLYKKFSVFKLIAVLMMIISMYMMGTRVLGWGLLMVLFIMFGMYIFFKFKKDSFCKKTVMQQACILIFATILFFFSPIMLRGSDKQPGGVDFDELGRINQAYLDEYEYGDVDSVRKNVHATFVLENAYNFSVATKFLEIYKYEVDPYFWLKHFTIESYKDRGNYRVIQTGIWNRTHEVYGDIKTELFGFSYSSTFTNGMILEKDILAQKNYFGWIGMLLFIGPFIAVVGYSIYMVLRYKKLFKFKNLTYILALGLTLSVSVFSGNMLDIFIVTIPFVIISSMLIYNLNEKKREG